MLRSVAPSRLAAATTLSIASRSVPSTGRRCAVEDRNPSLLASPFQNAETSNFHCPCAKVRALLELVKLAPHHSGGLLHQVIRRHPIMSQRENESIQTWLNANQQSGKFLALVQNKFLVDVAILRSS